MPNPSPPPLDGQQPEKSGGCLKTLLILGVVAVLLLGGGGWYAYRKVVKSIKGTMLPMVTANTAIMLREFKFSAEDSAKIQGAVDDAVKQIEDDRLGLTQGMLAAMDMAAQPISMGLAMQGFIVKYIEPSDLSAAAKTEAKTTALRFARTGGVVTLTGKGGTPDPLMNILLLNPKEFTEMVNSQKKTTGVSVSVTTGPLPAKAEMPKFKPKLTTPELESALAEMKRRADAAGVPPAAPEMKYGPEFQKALATAISHPGMSSAPPLLPGKTAP